MLFLKLNLKNKDKRGGKSQQELSVAVLILSFSPCILWVCFGITEAVLNSNDKAIGSKPTCAIIALVTQYLCGISENFKP